jgi:hypothetical protein
MSKNLKVKDHNKFRCFDYENEINPNKYQLGDVLYKSYKDLYDDSEQEDEIGVVIQTFEDGDVRTDMWGMCSESEVRYATHKEVEVLRPKLINELN